MKRLTDETKKLPDNRGSAIVGALQRAALRIPRDGETVVYVLSDMREINESYNFGRQIPSEKEFLDFHSAKSIKPRFSSSTKIRACGVHPYNANNAWDYEQLLLLWQSVFRRWKVDARISEVCDFKH